MTTATLHHRRAARAGRRGRSPLRRATRASTYDERVAASAAALAWAHETFGDSLVVASSMGDEALVHLAADARARASTSSSSTPATTSPRRSARATPSPPSTTSRMRTILPLLTVERAGRAVRRGPVRDRPRPVLRAAQGGAARARPRAVRGVGHRHAPRGRPDPHRTSRSSAGTPSAARSSSTRSRPGPRTTSTPTSTSNGVLLNPLRQDGYASIGCAPCTRARRARRGPARGPLERPDQDRVRAAHVSATT